MLKELIREKVDEIFLVYQEINHVTDGDIKPFDAMKLDQIEEELATLIERVVAYQPKEIVAEDFTPSWYIYTDCDGDAHDIVYGYDNTNGFFVDVSKRIAFDDCTDETVHKIFWKGKEVVYAGWQPGMRFEYKDLDGNTVWVGQFEHWDH
jgi:hypothetical protein